MGCGIALGARQLITRDSLIIMRERHPTTTTAPISVAEHFVTSMQWSPNQRMIATLSSSPRIRIWRADAALKGASDAGEMFGNNGECLTTLHGHLRSVSHSPVVAVFFVLCRDQHWACVTGTRF